MESMIKPVIKKLISDGITTKKISSAEGTLLNSYVDGFTDKNYLEIPYSQFDKETSAGIIFTDAERTAKFSTGDNPLKVGNITEEKSFIVANTVTCTYGDLLSLSVYNKNSSVQYILGTDYTVVTGTGVVTREITGAITALETVTLVYESDATLEADTAVLQTTEITFPDSVLKAVLIDADDNNVTFEMAKNILDFYTINNYNIGEEISSSDKVYFRIITKSPNTIRKVMIIFDKTIS